MKEIWKDIKDYEGLYQVSNYGNAKTLGNKFRKTIKLLKPVTTIPGYRLVILVKDRNKKAFTIHSLVWDCFGNEQRNGRILQVDHIDGNKLNNRIDNLQLLSHRKNISKGFKLKKKTSRYTGVCWNKQMSKWYVSIMIDKKNIFLGLFDDEYDAHSAYQKELIKIN